MGVCILVSLGKHVGSVNWRVIGRRLYQQIWDKYLLNI